MQYLSSYTSPIGQILIAADEEGLNGVWFENQACFADQVRPGAMAGDNEWIEKTRLWLDAYFQNDPLPEMPVLHVNGTEFQMLIWSLIEQVSDGELSTYKELARQAAGILNRSSMSAQAVGSAVGKNPVSILVGCHRIIGTDRSLTGYAGGLDRKIWLLKHEGHSVDETAKKVLPD